jgi:hypothetical protein
MRDPPVVSGSGGAGPAGPAGLAITTYRADDHGPGSVAATGTRHRTVPRWCAAGEAVRRSHQERCRPREGVWSVAWAAADPRPGEAGTAGPLSGASPYRSDRLHRTRGRARAARSR